MPHSNKKIDQQISTILKVMENLEEGGAREVVQKMDELRRKIVLIIAEEDKLSASTSSSVKERILSVIEQHRPAIEEHLTTNQRRLFIKGLQLVDAAVKGADIRTAVPYLSEQMLEQVKTYSADLIKGLTDQARQKVTQEIDLAVLGQKPVNDVINAIGKNLKDPSIFGTVAKRAETIFRTEVGRMSNMATVKRMEQLKDQVPDIRREWLHSHRGIPRPGHLILDGVVVPQAEKFRLVAKSGQIFMIDSPKDPILPVGEIVNCGCLVIPNIGRYHQEKGTA